MRKRKIDFHRGSGIALFGFMMMLLCLIVALALMEQYSLQLNSETTQMAADSMADGIAAYSVNQTGTDDERFNEASQFGNKILRAIKNNTSVRRITEMDLDEDAYKDEKLAAVTLKAKYYNIDDYNGAYKRYFMERTSKTSFSPMYSQTDFIFPIMSHSLSSRFGNGRDTSGYQGSSAATEEHPALDIADGRQYGGEPFYAIGDGVVVEPGIDTYHSIKIDHGENENGEHVYSVYKHGNAVAGLHVGQTVTKGEQIGTTYGWGPDGGLTYATHLHLEIIVKDAANIQIYKNPLTYAYGMTYDGTNDRHTIPEGVVMPDGTNSTYFTFGESTEEQYFQYENSTGYGNGSRFW